MTAIPSIKEAIEVIGEKALTDNVEVIIGGVFLIRQFAEGIRADTDMVWVRGRRCRKWIHLMNSPRVRSYLERR